MALSCTVDSHVAVSADCSGAMVEKLDEAQDWPSIHSSVVPRVPCTVRCCFSKSKNMVSTYEKLPVQGDPAVAA